MVTYFVFILSENNQTWLIIIWSTMQLFSSNLSHVLYTHKLRTVHGQEFVYVFSPTFVVLYIYFMKTIIFSSCGLFSHAFANINVIFFLFWQTKDIYNWEIRPYNLQKNYNSLNNQNFTLFSFLFLPLSTISLQI